MNTTGFFIDVHKALVIPVTVAAMLTFANYSTVMWPTWPCTEPIPSCG